VVDRVPGPLLGGEVGVEEVVEGIEPPLQIVLVVVCLH